MIAAPENPAPHLAPLHEVRWLRLRQAAEFLLREHVEEVRPYGDPARPGRLLWPHAVALIRAMHAVEPLPFKWQNPATGRIEPLPPGSQVLWHGDMAGTVLYEYEYADPGGRWRRQKLAGWLLVSQNSLVARVASLPDRRAEAAKEEAEAARAAAERAAEMRLIRSAVAALPAQIAAAEAEARRVLEAHEAELDAALSAASSAASKPPTRRPRRAPGERHAIPPWPPIRADTPAATVVATEAIRRFLDDEGIQERVHPQREECLRIAGEAASEAAARADDEAGGDRNPPDRRKLGRLWREQVALRRRWLGLPDEATAGPK
jgi:hypothetical protein